MHNIVLSFFLKTDIADLGEHMMYETYQTSQMQETTQADLSRCANT